MDSVSSSSILSNKLIEDNYKLALKLFVNKNYEKSWAIVSLLYHQLLSEYEKGIIGERLLVKVISLFLIEIGVNISDASQLVDDVLINSLTSKTILNQSCKIFGSAANVPLEVLYNYYLIFATNPKLYQGNNQFVEDLDQLYLSLPYSQSKYYQKLIDLYVYELLPALDKFDQANAIIDSNQLYSESATQAREKLNQVHQLKQKQQDYEKQLQQEKLRKQQELQKQKDQQAKLQSQKQLEYVKLNELSKSRETVKNNQGPTQSQLELLMGKLRYLLGISSAYIQQNSIFLLAGLVVILISSKFINYRKLNIKERLLETVQMAFKVSYL